MTIGPLHLEIEPLTFQKMTPLRWHMSLPSRPHIIPIWITNVSNGIQVVLSREVVGQWSPNLCYFCTHVAIRSSISLVIIGPLLVEIEQLIVRKKRLKNIRNMTTNHKNCMYFCSKNLQIFIFFLFWDRKLKCLLLGCICQQL